MCLIQVVNLIVAFEFNRGVNQILSAREHLEQWVLGGLAQYTLPCLCFSHNNN